VSYRKTLPIGFTMSNTTLSSSSNAPNQSSHVLHENVTPVQVVAPLYPEACAQRDAYGQLPLHIVIDTYKQYRVDSYKRLCRREPPWMESTVKSSDQEPFDVDDIRRYNEEEDTVIQLLIQLHPPSIHMRDGRTMLYPYQQAAVHDRIDTLTAIGSNKVTNRKQEGTQKGNMAEGEWDDHGCRLTTIYHLLRRNPTLI
jgi:hypothetical protein